MAYLTSVCKAARGARHSWQRRLRPQRSIRSMGKALYIQSVEDAASIAGGYEQLAAQLGVSVDEVESWSAGSVIPECAVFLRLIEILVHT